MKTQYHNVIMQWIPEIGWNCTFFWLIWHWNMLNG